MAYCTVTIICSTTEFPKIVETLLNGNVPLMVATQQPAPDILPKTEPFTDILPEKTPEKKPTRGLNDTLLTLPKRKFKQKKHFCPVPDCKRTKPVYLYQHLRSKHKMPFSEMKKWRNSAKQQ